MNLTLDCSLRELLRQALEYNSVHGLLYVIGELERAPDAETFANMAVKLLPNHEEN